MLINKEIFESLFIPEPNTGCFLWLGSEDKDRGYVWMSHTVKKTASRLSYEFYKGDISTGLVVRHTCDNPHCVNPSHLILGTHKDNREDCVRRNRHAKGLTYVGYRKLTYENVLYVRASKQTSVSLAKEFNVNPSTISRIRSGENWRTKFY